MTGAIFSFFTFLLVMSYGGYKMKTLMSLTDYSVQQSDQFEHFPPEATFGADDQFAVAFGFIGWDQDGTPIDDPSIAELKFFMKSWGTGTAGGMVEL